MKAPQPNYEFFVEAMQNKKPARMPIYEHHIDPGFIEKVIHVPMTRLFQGGTADKKEYFHHFVDFWEACGYDTVSFELGIPLSCPGSGCLRAARNYPIIQPKLNIMMKLRANGMR